MSSHKADSPASLHNSDDDSTLEFGFRAMATDINYMHLVSRTWRVTDNRFPADLQNAIFEWNRASIRLLYQLEHYVPNPEDTSSDTFATRYEKQVADFNEIKELVKSMAAVNKRKLQRSVE